jgi:sugar-specific transcriptional regulator TrmB
MAGNIKRATKEDLQRLSESLTGPQMREIQAQQQQQAGQLTALQAEVQRLREEIVSAIAAIKSAFALRLGKIDSRAEITDKQIARLSVDQQEVTAQLVELIRANDGLSFKVSDAIDQVTKTVRMVKERETAMQSRQESLSAQISEGGQRLNQIYSRASAKVDGAVGQAIKVLEAASAQALKSLDAGREALTGSVAEVSRRLAQADVKVAGMDKEIQALKERVGNG